MNQTKLLYAGANRLTAMKLAHLDLPEGNAMREPRRGPGLMVLEVAMDEMAEKKSGWTRRVPHTQRHQVDPRTEALVLASGPRRLPEARRGEVRLVEAATRSRGQMRDGQWLVGVGMAAAFRNNMVMKSARGCGGCRRHGHGRDRHDDSARQLHHHRQTAGRDDGLAGRQGGRPPGRLLLPGLLGLRRAVRRQLLDGRRLCRLREAARGRGAAPRHQFADAVFATGRCGRQPRGAARRGGEQG